MSINVNVSGNPVCIKRGKMVTADLYNPKGEFQKRRLMRLEQVRQQSKDIAEDIRNKVRKERQKNSNLAEKQCKEKLKNLKNRRLLDLENQYKEELNEIGRGHKEALEIERDEEIKMKRQEEENLKAAHQRGKEALNKIAELEKEKNELQKKMLNRKKLLKEMGSIRYFPNKNQMKSSTKKKKKKKADINISIPDSDSGSESTWSDSDDDENGLTSITEEGSDFAEEESCLYSEEDENMKRQPLRSFNNNIIETSNKSNQTRPRSKEDQKKGKKSSTSSNKSPHHKKTSLASSQRLTSPPGSPRTNIPKKSPKKYSTLKDTQLSDSQERVLNDIPLETRISERIRQRNLMSTKPESELNDDLLAHHDQLLLTSGEESKLECGCSNQNVKRQDLEKVPCSCCRHPSICGARSEIPEKPPMRLKPSLTKLKPVAKDGDKSSRVGVEKAIQAGSYVEKVLSDDMEIVPNPLKTEEEYRIKMQQRDREAQARGRKAVERERAKRDYNEMMKRLPLLQKQERISQIAVDKPEFHMSRERLEEREKEKQLRIENAFNRKFPAKPAMVTIPPKEEKEEYEKGKWESVKSETSFNEVRDIIKGFNNRQPEDRKKKLKELLRSLKLQKEQLLREIRSLPKDDSIAQLIGDLDSLEESPTKRQKIKRKRSPLKVSSSESITSSESDEYQRKKVKNKTKTKIVVLQNTSTQTTPKITTDNCTETKSPPEKKVEKKEELCPKNHKPCDCSESKGTSDEYQILIKINDKDKTPEVLVQPGITKVPKDKEEKDISKGKFKRIISHLEDSRARSEGSWKDEFSKSTNGTSTSYYSPPSYSQEKEISSNKKNLRSKPKQENLDLTERDINMRLMTCVKRLLSMSRNSIDELGMSTSTVQTPSQSVIEMESNNPSTNQPASNQFNLSLSNVLPKEMNLSSDPIINGSIEFASKATSDRPDASSYVNRYADVTESCSKRIASLAAQIQKIREEKRQMMNSPVGSFSEKPQDQSTAYLDVPHNSSKGSNSSKSSLNEEELQSKLLNIDMDLAKKLTNKKNEQIERIQFELREEDTEIMKRLENLTKPYEQEKKSEFVPFLSDIPKQPPKLDIRPEGGESFDATDLNHRKPPLSKGIVAVKRQSGSLSIVPHELSTIVEADSLASTKVDTPRSKSDEYKKKSKVEETKSSFLKDSQTDPKCPCTSCPASPKKSVKKKDYSKNSSSSDADSIESMLRSIGMEWAIPTLHKTQDALALSSSTSSVEVSSRKVANEGNSDVSIKDILKKRMLGKVSSAKSETSPNSLLSDFSDLSAIQGSIEKVRNQRTSTPVPSGTVENRSQGSSGLLGVSDISSVREHSPKKNAKQSFYSLTEMSHSKEEE